VDISVNISLVPSILLFTKERFYFEYNISGSELYQLKI
jgi:hypothetical protein